MHSQMLYDGWFLADSKQSRKLTDCVRLHIQIDRFKIDDGWTTSILTFVSKTVELMDMS